MREKEAFGVLRAIADSYGMHDPFVQAKALEWMRKAEKLFEETEQHIRNNRETGSAA